MCRTWGKGDQFGIWNSSYFSNVPTSNVVHYQVGLGWVGLVSGSADRGREGGRTRNVDWHGDGDGYKKYINIVDDGESRENEREGMLGWDLNCLTT